ncbi:MAG: LacI family DNA-binding transcriptional regulator [Actinomycetota bacterium]
MADDPSAPKRPQKATLHDVADLVGVSPRTVSRVVNDEGGFSDATRERVLDAIAELNYRPNLVARSLVTSQSNTLALIITDIADPFFAELANGIQQAAQRRGMSVFLAVSENDADTESELLGRLMSQAVDGAILFPASHSIDGPIHFARLGLPIVAVDTEFDHDNICCVRSDLEHGVALAVDHLRTRGRRRLAMLTNGNLPPHRRRRENHFRSLVATDTPVVTADPTSTGGYEAARTLLDTHPDVDAVFAYNDVMAIGALAAFREADRRVPDDIAVVGCDDIAVGTLLPPALTTIKLDHERLGETAVACLQELLTATTRPDPITVPIDLVVRAST